MMSSEPRRNAVITLNTEEYRTLCYMLGFACGRAEMQTGEEKKDWLLLSERLTREISDYFTAADPIKSLRWTPPAANFQESGK